MNRLIPLLVLTSGLMGPGAHAQAPLYADDFETDTSANWAVFEGSGNGVPDFTAEFSFDYSQQKFVASGVTNTIPPAPNSAAGTTRGVKLTVNKDNLVDPADATASYPAAVNLYPKAQSFSGNYALRCDLWINYNGGRFGGTGSTEFGILGINHAADKVNWPNGSDSDGSWFAVAGEGGAARDYRAYDGMSGAAPAELQGLDAGFLDRNEDGLTEFETNPDQTPLEPLWAMFPEPAFETPGAPGKRWVQVEVAQRNGNLIWKMDGFIIAERPNASGWTTGNIMIGTMDVFASIADPKEDNFVIFDNVRVVNLDAEPAPPKVKVEVTDADAGEPANPGVFTISREGGDQTQPLEVAYRIGGTATPGTDFATDGIMGLKATIPANAASVDVAVQPVDNLAGEPVETVILTLAGNAAFEMGLNVSATLELKDDGDTIGVTIAPKNPFAYERIAGDELTFEVRREGDTANDLSVNLTYAGTATQDDYDGALRGITIPAGELATTLVLTPKDDALVEGNETVEVTLVAGGGYTVGPNHTATGTLIDDDLEARPVLFAEDFNADTSANWQIRFGAGNNIQDYQARFAYDYSADGIPPAPHGNGDTKGLRLTVNKDEGTATGAAGVNLYPAGKSFSGAYALRFDMYLTFNPVLAGTTEHAIFGINHSGSYTNRHNAAGGDGLWFAAETDGSASSGRSYVSYVGKADAVPAFQARPAGDFAAYFTAPPYLAAGAPSGVWVDVEVSQVSGVVTWKINGTTLHESLDVADVNSGNLMLGYMDTFNSIGAPDNYVIYDNVRVVQLEEPSVSIAKDGAELVLTFTGVLQSSATVEGAYLDVSDAQSPLRVAPTAATSFWRARAR